MRRDPDSSPDQADAEVVDGTPQGTDQRTDPGYAREGYGDRPSRAWLRTQHQFVLIKARQGSVDETAFALARIFVAQVERFDPGQSAPDTHLMLRGIELRGNGRATAYLDLLCPADSASPYLDLRATQSSLERRVWSLGDISLSLIVKAQVVPVAPGDGGPLDDRYYERVRQAMDW